MLLSVSTMNNSIRIFFNFLSFFLSTLFSTTHYKHRGRLLLSQCAIQFKLVSLTDIYVYFCPLISEAWTVFLSKVKGYVKELVISSCS